MYAMQNIFKKWLVFRRCAFLLVAAVVVLVVVVVVIVVAVVEDLVILPFLSLSKTSKIK